MGTRGPRITITKDVHGNMGKKVRPRQTTATRLRFILRICTASPTSSSKAPSLAPPIWSGHGISPDFLQSKNPGVLSLPFIFKDSEAAGVLGGPGKRVRRRTGEKTLSSVGGRTGCATSSRRNRSTVSRISKGLKLRVINSAEMIDTINAFSASAVPMAFNDVYSTRQLKTIDGCEGTTTHMLTQKYFELTKSAALLWYMHVNPLVASKRLWDSIPRGRQGDLSRRIQEDEAPSPLISETDG